MLGWEDVFWFESDCKLPGCQAQVGSSLSIGTRKRQGLQASFCSPFPSSCLPQPYPSFLINLGWKLFCGFIAISLLFMFFISSISIYCILYLYMIFSSFPSFLSGKFDYWFSCNINFYIFNISLYTEFYPCPCPTNFNVVLSLLFSLKYFIISIMISPVTYRLFTKVLLYFQFWEFLKILFVIDF